VQVPRLVLVARPPAVVHQAGLLGSAHVRPPLAPLSDPGKQRVMSLLREGATVLNPPVTGLAPLN
jgi:hypothetical protein